MNTTPEQFATSNKVAAEALTGLASAQLVMVERLADLNFSASKAAFEDGIKYLRAALSAKDPQELITLNAAAAQPAMEKALAYARSVYEVVAESQGSFTKLFEVQTSDMSKNVASLLDQYSKSGAPGSDIAAAAVKSAFAAASTAYDSYSKVAKQTTELAQANIAAASNVAKEAHKRAGA